MEKRGDVGTHTPGAKQECCGGRCKTAKFDQLPPAMRANVEKDILDRAAERKTQD